MTDPLNTIPDHVRTVHLIAACGTAMGALAAMLADLGLQVSGSDHNVYPPMSDFLARRGIHVAEGFRAENLDHCPDLVVVGNAVIRDNPEARRMTVLGLCYCSLPQAVRHFLARGKTTLMTAGTHGKTTSAGLLAHVLHAGGCDPSFLVGGILAGFDSNYRMGSGRHLVLEGDEYDTAYFDKQAKFFHYPAQAAVLTSVEFDHADIYTDFDHVRRTFARFVAAMPPAGLLVAHHGDAEVRRLASGAPCEVQTYGQDPAAEWSYRDARPSSGGGLDFTLLRRGRPLAAMRSRLAGTHNLLNTLAVIAVAHGQGLTLETIAGALEAFQGVRRRQELRGEKRGIRVMDDFAHHPTAVRETLRAVKPLAAPGRLIAVFEPRTNTSMRDVFQQTYVTVFDPADLICIRRAPRLDKIPADRRFSARTLVADLRRRGRKAHYFPDTGGLIAFLAEAARPGDLILIMSNGGFDDIHRRLLETL